MYWLTGSMVSTGNIELLLKYDLSLSQFFFAKGLFPGDSWKSPKVRLHQSQSTSV